MGTNVSDAKFVSVWEAKMFFYSNKNIFCFRAPKFDSATYVFRAAKETGLSATMFPSLSSRCYMIFWPALSAEDTYLFPVFLGKTNSIETALFFPEVMSLKTKMFTYQSRKNL